MPAPVRSLAKHLENNQMSKNIRNIPTQAKNGNKISIIEKIIRVSLNRYTVNLVCFLSHNTFSITQTKNMKSLFVCHPPRTSDQHTKTVSLYEKYLFHYSFTISGQTYKLIQLRHVLPFKTIELEVQNKFLFLLTF